TISGAEDLIALQMLKLHQFLQMLWIVKDNAARVESGFLDTPKAVSSRIWPFLCTKADRTNSTTTFLREELTQANKMFHALCGESKSLEAADLTNVRAREIVEPEMPPLSKALFFIGAARLSSSLAVKIANYCSALEALLIAGATTELTYRLCQRVAWLLGES